MCASKASTPEQHGEFYNKNKFVNKCQYECIENGCSHLDSLSVKYLGCWTELKGNQQVELKYGYKAIIDSMIEKIGSKNFDSKIKRRHSLSRILLCENLLKNENVSRNSCEHCLYTNEENKVVLLVENKIENTNVVFICNHVICTMSLGYLKENFNKIFFNHLNKSLFTEKFLSINRLGYGNVNKVGWFFYSKSSYIEIIKI